MPRTRLAHVLLSNKPKPDFKGGWPAMSHRNYDVREADYDTDDGWSLACDVDRVGAGTVGWIHRADGAFGHLAALIVFDGRIRARREHGNKIT